jgi:hypothetical protein
MPLPFLIFSSIHVRDQLVDHGWCSRVASRFTSFNTDDFDQIEKTINAMLSLIDACRVDFVSLLPTLDKFNQIFTKKNIHDDLSSMDILNNIQILLTKLRQRSPDDL